MTSHVDVRLRRQILVVLGISLLTPACIGETVTIDDDSGDGSSGSSSSSSMSASSGSTPSGVDSSVPPDEEPDCGSAVSRVVCVAPPGEDGSTGFEASTDGGESIGESSDDGATGDGTGTSDGGGTEGVSSSGDEPTGPISCEGVVIDDFSFCVYDMGEIYVEDGQCCQLLEGYQNCCDGRPFIVHDEVRTASLVPRRDWCGTERPRVDELDRRTRDELARAWRADGLMEHASIASFSRFVLHLVALGAPPQLVREAQQALADEIEHARTCFALASAYAGEPMGPGPLSIDGAMAGSVTLASAAVAAVREGCIGETLAAYQAEMAASRAREPVVRRALRGIAADEARHAQLAWTFVAWAMERGGAEVRDAVAGAFAEHGAAVTGDSGETPVTAATWNAHGRLTPSELAEVLERGRSQIVMPCARALLRSLEESRPSARPMA